MHSSYLFTEIAILTTFLSANSPEDKIKVLKTCFRIYFPRETRLGANFDLLEQRLFWCHVQATSWTLSLLHACGIDLIANKISGLFEDVAMVGVMNGWCQRGLYKHYGTTHSEKFSSYADLLGRNRRRAQWALRLFCSCGMSPHQCSRLSQIIERTRHIRHYSQIDRSCSITSIQGPCHFFFFLIIFIIISAIDWMCCAWQYSWGRWTIQWYRYMTPVIPFV